MDKKYKEQQLKTKLEKAQEKLKEYKKKLKITPAILFIILYSGIFTMMFPIGGIVGIIKALLGGFTAIGTSIYFWIYREKTEPKYEEYVKFLEKEQMDLEDLLKELANEKVLENVAENSKPVVVTRKKENEITQNYDNNDDLNINSL